MASTPGRLLRAQLDRLARSWSRNGIPTRSELVSLFREMMDSRASSGSPGLWDPPPLMITATLDDGWGHGIEVIELCAKAAGLRVVSMGLLQAPDSIIAKCRELSPDLLGLTVLQLDSEPDLAVIREHLPPAVRVVAGGPPFQIDSELAARAGVDFAARHVLDFLQFLLAFRNPCTQ